MRGKCGFCNFLDGKSLTCKHGEIMVKPKVSEAFEALISERYADAYRLYLELGNLYGHENFEVNLTLCQARLQPPEAAWLSQIPAQLMRVACVMDEFTYSAYQPECQLLQLRPEGILTQIQDFKPHLLFVESAWRGVDGLWTKKISSNSPDIQTCVDWCRRNDIPTVFWNKEDPVHFSTFLPLAKLFDYIFTSDADCIPYYTREVLHDRVYALPFGVQPKHHNPVQDVERKPGFSFAGSYYLRYPERQRDFATLMESAKDFGRVIIFDRNADNPHPNHTFPVKYRPHIAGKLPFNEINQAYKGYQASLNLNTIKNSPSMFARRVFELLASNTMVLSNFSRGLRLLFGDLVISSDEKSEIKRQLEKEREDNLRSEKKRLMGLRKVMDYHTYAHRIALIRSVVSGMSEEKSEPLVMLLARVQTASQYTHVLDCYSRQKYRRKSLSVFNPDRIMPVESALNYADFSDIASCLESVKLSGENVLSGFFDALDYYGPEYVTDLAHACQYCSADAVGKGNYFEFVNGVELVGNGDSYKYADILPVRASLVRRRAVGAEDLERWLQASGEASYAFPEMLITDKFNYLKYGAAAPQEMRRVVDDLGELDTGIPWDNRTYQSVNAYSGDPKHSLTSGRVELGGDDLRKRFKDAAGIILSTKDGGLRIDSALHVGQHRYVYAEKADTREGLNLILNSEVNAAGSGSLDVRIVFEFQDLHSKKISHQMLKLGDSGFLAIPEDCVKIRLGWRISGPGSANIKTMTFEKNTRPSGVVVPVSSRLVLTKQYPAYDDLYRYGFLHTRVVAYKKAGFKVDVFKITERDFGYREFQGVDIIHGDRTRLENTLASGQIDHVLVHLLDEQMWRCLEKFVDSVQVTIWIHGADIQMWHRRAFDHFQMTEQEIERRKRLSEARARLWRKVMKEPHPNVRFVFVSETFYRESVGDLGFEPPPGSVRIIHNPVDTGLFQYVAKPAEQRKRILSVRSYASRTYANDLTVKAIQALSLRDGFEELEFALYGDGELFDDTVEPVRGFPNVSINKGFKSQQEIAKIHLDYGVFLIPTRSDTQGVSRDEAMASGLVPITNAVAAIPEFVDETCGILAPAEDHEVLAAGIERLYKSPELFLRLSENAAKRVRRQTSADSIIPQELDLLSRALLGREVARQN